MLHADWGEGLKSAARSAQADGHRSNIKSSSQARLGGGLRPRPHWLFAWSTWGRDPDLCVGLVVIRAALKFGALPREEISSFTAAVGRFVHREWRKGMLPSVSRSMLPLCITSRDRDIASFSTAHRIPEPEDKSTQGVDHHEQDPAHQRNRRTDAPRQ